MDDILRELQKDIDNIQTQEVNRVRQIDYIEGILKLFKYII